MINQKVRCDECGWPTKMDIRVRHFGGGKQEIYFKCEHCDHKYTCYVTDKGARRLQEQVRKTKHPLIKLQLQLKLKERMDKLKAELVTGG